MHRTTKNNKSWIEFVSVHPELILSDLSSKYSPKDRILLGYHVCKLYGVFNKVSKCANIGSFKTTSRTSTYCHPFLAIYNRGHRYHIPFRKGRSPVQIHIVHHKLLLPKHRRCPSLRLYYITRIHIYNDSASLKVSRLIIVYPVWHCIKYTPSTKKLAFLVSLV